MNCRPLDPLTGALVRPFEIFRGLQVRDATLRSSATANVLERLRKYEDKMDSDHTYRTALIWHLPTVFRLSYECPYEDVRSGFLAYLDHLSVDKGIIMPHVPPVSSFIPQEKMIPRQSENEHIRGLFELSFQLYGRVSCLSNALAYHPAYLECMLSTFNVVLHEEGPLPLTWRTYLAVMACSRHHCVYMLRRQQDMFLQHGGDIDWLKQGLASPSLPRKLTLVAELNALLAHRPWLLTAAHIKALIAGMQSEASGATVTSGWSLNELVHAIVILCTFHSLCSIVEALALVREPDNGVLTGTHTFTVIDRGEERAAPANIPTTTSETAPAYAADATEVAAKEEMLRSRLLAPQKDLDAMSEIGYEERLPAHASVGGKSQTSRGTAHKTPKVTPRRASVPTQTVPVTPALEVVDEGEDGGGGWNLGAGSDSDISDVDSDGASDGADDDDDGDDDDDYDEDDDFERAGAGPVFDEVPLFRPEAVQPCHTDVAAIDADPSDPFSKFLGSGPLTHIPVRDEREEDRIKKKKLRSLRRNDKRRGKSEGGAGEESGEEDSLDAPAELDIRTLRYADFDTHDGMFVTHDFSWEDHAYSLLQRFYPAAAPVLDNEFRLTYNLTYHTFGAADSSIDTELFRTAIWYYIQRLYGVRNDHYDYKEVNAFMTISTKGFAKKIACYPEIITEADFNGFTTTFGPDEKIHIIMLATEARRQAALLYGLRSIMQHMTA